MSKTRKWSEQEDKQLIKAIKRNPENLHKAFIVVSKKIERSDKACAQRWYSHISKSNLKDVSNICFAIFSKNKYAVNRKNPKKVLPKETRKTFWKSLTTFFSSLFG